jgi:hypothetical protein
LSAHAVLRRCVPVAAFVSSALALGLAASRAAAQGNEAFQVPTDGAAVRMELLTVGRGPEAYALFGHTILRVVPTSAGAGLDVNWGTFDFRDPGFLWKFYVGDLNYWMAFQEPGLTVRQYRDYEHRRVVADDLVLTSKQRGAVLRRLAWNAQPANVHYQYDQFYANCATKLRDTLDEALGGKLKAYFEARPSRVTFRRLVRDDASPSPWVNLGLEIVTNGVLDAPITEWDEMFLPARMRELLREFPALDDDGRPVAGATLVAGARVLVEAPEPAAGGDPFRALTIGLGLPMIALALLVARRRPRAPGDPSTERVVARLLAVPAVVLGLALAVWGTLLVANWALSRYPYAKHHGALWLASPLDWLFPLYGLRLAFAGRRPARAPWVRRLALAHVAAVPACALLLAVGVIQQDLAPLLASFGVANVAAFAAIAAWGSAAASPVATLGSAEAASAAPTVAAREAK